MLENSDINKFYQQDRSAIQDILDERIPDLHFARYGQNDDVDSASSSTEFVGEFNIISRERKRIQSELRQNQVEVKFRSLDDDDDDLDDLMQGMYRTDRRNSKSKQTFQIAQDDVIDCGYGAWRLYTDDVTDNLVNTDQEVKREPIPEAIRKVFWDADALMADKSDAKRCSVIHEFTRSGYEDFLEENEIDTDKIIYVSFDKPYQSIYEQFNGASLYPFFNSEYEKLTVLEFYSIESKMETHYIYRREDGSLYSMKKQEADQQINTNEPEGTKRVRVARCYKYLTNGIEILKRTEVPGGKIPIIPVYGERNFVNGKENFYGIVKAAKDPQKLLNSCLNYLANMMMFSPVPKPEFDPRELEGINPQFHEGGANNSDYAYVQRNKYYTDDESGQVLDFVNATYTRSPEIPTSVAQLMQILPQLTDNILNPGVTEESFDTDASGVALQEIKEVIGMMTFIFLDNFAEAMRRDGEVWAAMKSAITDTERNVIVTNADGTTGKERVMQEEMSVEFDQFGEIQINQNYRNDIRNAKFNVYYDIGPSYQSQRSAVLGNLKELFATLPDGHPVKDVVMLNILSKQDGEGMDEINQFARYSLLEQGLPGFEPQNEAEEEFVNKMMQEQSEQTDPMQELVEVEKQKVQIQSLESASKAKLNEEKAKTEQFNRLQKLAETELTKAEAAEKEAQAMFDRGMMVVDKNMQIMNQQMQYEMSIAEQLRQATQNIIPQGM